MRGNAIAVFCFGMYSLLFFCDPFFLLVIFGRTSELGIWWHHTIIRAFVMFTNKCYAGVILNIQQLLTHQCKY